MKTEANNPRVSRALREVWEWKASIYREVQNLPLPEALHSIMDMARNASAAASYVKHGSPRTVQLRVAESRAQYKTGDQ